MHTETRTERADREMQELHGIVANWQRDESPWERLRRLHAELMGTDDDPSLARRQPTLVLIRGGRDDA